MKSSITIRRQPQGDVSRINIGKVKAIRGSSEMRRTS